MVFDSDTQGYWRTDFAARLVDLDLKVVEAVSKLAVGPILVVSTEQKG